MQELDASILDWKSGPASFSMLPFGQKLQVTGGNCLIEMLHKSTPHCQMSTPHPGESTPVADLLIEAVHKSTPHCQMSTPHPVPGFAVAKLMTKQGLQCFNFDCNGKRLKDLWFGNKAKVTPEENELVVWSNLWTIHNGLL